MPSNEAVATRHKHRDFVTHLVFGNSQNSIADNPCKQARRDCRKSYIPVACRGVAVLALFPVFGHGFGRNSAQVSKLLDLPSILLVKDIRKLPSPGSALGGLGGHPV